MSKLPADPPSANFSPSSPLDESLRALGFKSPRTEPTRESPIQDLLLYALTQNINARPELDMVQLVAAELEALAEPTEGPWNTTLIALARRLRAAIDLAQRLSAARAAP